MSGMASTLSEPDLDWGDEIPIEEEANISEGRSIFRTEVKYRSTAPDGRDWAEAFREYRAAGNERRALKRESAEVVDSWVPDTLPQSPKKVLTAVEALGWEYRIGATRVHVPDEIYVADSKATGAKAGDVKKSAHDVEYLWIAAAGARSPRLGFIATWKANRFESAKVFDPVGMPVENYADYGLDGSYAKTLNLDEHEASAIAARRSAEYNDGSSRLEHCVVYASADPFNRWLDDYLELFAPDAKRLTVQRKPRKKKEEAMDEMALIAGEEWTG